VYVCACAKEKGGLLIPRVSKPKPFSLRVRLVITRHARRPVDTTCVQVVRKKLAAALAAGPSDVPVLRAKLGLGPVAA
jgi:hypothetical protein